jgi:hypothetical protein
LATTVHVTLKCAAGAKRFHPDRRGPRRAAGSRLGRRPRSCAGGLTKFGIHDDDDPKEIRADFLHLRRWRKSVEQVENLTVKMVITAIVKAA